jgi:hypothetical protein
MVFSFGSTFLLFHAVCYRNFTLQDEAANLTTNTLGLERKRPSQAPTPLSATEFIVSNRYVKLGDPLSRPSLAFFPDSTWKHQDDAMMLNQPWARPPLSFKSSSQTLLGILLVCFEVDGRQRRSGSNWIQNFDGHIPLNSDSSKSRGGDCVDIEGTSDEGLARGRL